MHFTHYTACLTALQLAGFSTAHLILKSPVPFGVDTLNNSPLVDTAIGSSTSDYPCKQRTGVYDISSMNNMAVGESQTLSFTGSASHGGGTCQLAVSLDHEPTTNSTWKIIQVYEGGCPVTAAGNGGTDTFTYSIPQGFPNGQATLSWTWYNRIGNREIYQNCAPITVTGGADNQDYYNTLPDLYIINLPSSECSSVETTNQIIPNPGQFVVKGDTSDKLASATGAACAAAAAAQTQGVQGYQSAVQSDGAGVASGTNTAATTTAATVNNGLYTQPAAAQATAAAGSVSTAMYTQSLATQAASSLMAAASTSIISLVVDPPSASALAVAYSTFQSLSVVTDTSAALYSAPTTLATASTLATSIATASNPAYAISTSASSSSSGADGVSSGTAGGETASDSSTNSTASGGSTCTTEGAVVCNGSSQFGLCNGGQVVWQAVAAGTTCSNGVIQKRSLRSQQLGRWFGI